MPVGVPASVGGIQNHPTPLHPSLARDGRTRWKKTHSWGTILMMFAQALRLRASSRSGCGAGCLPCGLPEASYARQSSSGLLLGPKEQRGSCKLSVTTGTHKLFCLTCPGDFSALFRGDLQLSLGGLQLPLDGLPLPLGGLQLVLGGLQWSWVICSFHTTQTQVVSKPAQLRWQLASHEWWSRHQSNSPCGE